MGGKLRLEPKHSSEEEKDSGLEPLEQEKQ